MVLEKTPESPLDCNQSILNEIIPDYSLEVLMLKLKLQYFGHLMKRTESRAKTLMLEKIEGGRRGWHRVRWLDGITDAMDMSWVSSRSWWWTGKPGVLQSMSWQRVRHGWATKLNWICHYKYVCIFAWVTHEDFPGSSEGKESASNAEDPDLIPWLERSPGEGNGNPLQYSCLENSMDRGAWQSTVPGVTKSVTWLSD